MSLNLQILLELTKILYEHNESEVRVDRKEKNDTDIKYSETRSYVVQLGSSTLTLSRTNGSPYSEREGQEIINQVIEIEEQKQAYNEILKEKPPLTSSELGLLVRGGSNDSAENLDHKKVDETLKESVEFEKLQKSVVSKSVKDSRSFSDQSFNKMVLRFLNKLEPIIGNPKFYRLLAETNKPVKSELSVSIEAPSKADMDPKPQKASGKRSSYIFAEALAPLNPHRWPAFAAGSSMASNMGDPKDKLDTPLANLLTTKEYLETSKSDAQWRSRFWEVSRDLALVNAASEVGGDAGAFIAGAATNKFADNYMTKMVMAEVTKTPQEELNLEIFKQTAREKGMDASEVRGTGVMREFVPEFMKRDICPRPEEDARPYSWEDSNYSYEDPSSFN